MGPGSAKIWCRRELMECKRWTCPVDSGWLEAAEWAGGPWAVTMVRGGKMAKVPDAERRLVVVTGGGSGIGGASALRMARAGRDVAVRDERGAEVVETIEGLGQAAGFVHLDVTDEAAVLEAMDGIARKFGRLDILVAAAPAPAFEPVQTRWSN